MDKRESERSARLAFITATKGIVALTNQLELVTDLLRRIYHKLAAVATKLEIAVDLAMEEDENDGESAG